MQPGEFHWNGWYFKRTPNGDVRIRHANGTGAFLEIPAAEWCSIIAHLSPKGSSLPGEAYGDAMNFHTRVGRTQHQRMRDSINDVELALNGIEIESVVRLLETAHDSVMVKVPLGALRRLARCYPELNRIVNDPALEGASTVTSHDQNHTENKGE